MASLSEWPDALIGITGYKQHGKNTIADILVEKYGYRLTSFASILKDAAYALDPIVHITYDGGIQRYRTIIDFYGVDKAKEQFPEVRRVLQYMGTEVGRKLLGEDIWVDAWRNSIKSGEKIVVADVRFPNEAKAIKDLGGLLWRVTRPGLPAPDTTHESEKYISTFDVHDDFVNETIQGLRNQVVANLFRLGVYLGETEPPVNVRTLYGPREFQDVCQVKDCGRDLFEELAFGVVLKCPEHGFVIRKTFDIPK